MSELEIELENSTRTTRLGQTTAVEARCQAPEGIRDEFIDKKKTVSTFVIVLGRPSWNDEKLIALALADDLRFLRLVRVLMNRYCHDGRLTVVDW